MEAAIKMMIGKVVQRDGGWDVSFAPDNTTWISVRFDQVEQPPEVGDEFEVIPPRVIGIRRTTITVVE